MNKRMTVNDLFRVIAEDTGFSLKMLSQYGSFTGVGVYFLEQCNAACAWLDKVYRTKYVNRFACVSLLKSRAGAYAGHNISASALVIAARHMGFTVLREGDEIYLNISKRSIPNCVYGAFPPGSPEYLGRWYPDTDCIVAVGGHITNKLPDWYKRQW